MAKIGGSTNEKIIPLKKWLGLNQAPDGDTKLKVGEASVMKNWRVTRDGNLKRRPGLTKLMGLATQYEAVVAEEAVVAKLNVNKWNLYSNYSVDQVTGSVTLPNEYNLGQFTIEQAQDLLDNAEEGQYYYLKTWTAYEDQPNYETFYRLASVGYTRETGGWPVWYGYLMTTEATEAGDDPAWIWTGYVGGKEQIVAACGGRVYALWDTTNEEFYEQKFLVGYIYKTVGITPTFPTSVCFFPFNNKLYILTDLDYYEWDGEHVAPATPPAVTEHFSTVSGYAPLIATSLMPNANNAPGSYELLEPVNRLTSNRRVWLSPDGTNKKFTLPEKNNADIIHVKNLVTGNNYIETTDYSYNQTCDEITFINTPAEGVNTIEVQYAAYLMSSDTGKKLRGQIINNTNYELYSGNTDTVVFLYGDGTNKCVYSGMDYDGMPRADYFPDLNDIRIGDENTPITQLIRHNAALIAYKKDSAWAIQQNLITLADGSQTFAYYVAPVNKAVGNEPVGQVQLVDNDPITLHNNNIYRWVNSSYYSSNLTRDERQARRISDRIQTACNEMHLANCVMWDDNDHQELYISNQVDRSLVWNYAQDVWYEYDIGPYAFINFRGTLYLCAGSAFFYEFDEDAYSDNGEVIKAELMSGAMDFGVDYGRKYSSMLWVGLKPADGTSVEVTVQTDRKNTFKDKIVPSYKAKIPGEPFMVKTKIKAKKFVYYRLILKCEELSLPVTVTAAEIRVRMTGYAK